MAINPCAAAPVALDLGDAAAVTGQILQIATATEAPVATSDEMEVSLLLENLHRAIDATSKGDVFGVSSAARTTLPRGGSFPVVSVPGFSDPGVDFHKWLSRAKIDKPTKFDGEPGEGSERVKAFLSLLQRYIAVTGLPLVSWGIMTAHFLQKSALLLWEIKFQGLITSHGPTAVTWRMFEKFMQDKYGQLQPACQIRAAYEELRESDFDSVSSFIRAFRIKERELVGTPYHPGGSAIFDFNRKLTPAVRTYVQDNAPEDWWTDVQQVYKKALNYELNKRAAVQDVLQERDVRVV